MHVSFAISSKTVGALVCNFSQGVPVIVLVFHGLNAAVVIKAAKFYCILRGFLCSLPSCKKSRERIPLLAGQEEG